eukprot:Tamp_07591.p1 GENE.Tamp_07591~~Tamp_07591.p1  ORF type:complete len:667 (+),score=156.84 Tamp_07591:227-2227(+)
MGAKNGKYQGDMRGGQRHGWGICAFSDRSFYEGEWVGDKMDGEGKYVRPDGSVYEGYWENNLQNGFGRLVLASGDVYEGSFRDGKMDGYGTYYYKNGSIYDGEFIEDEAHGVGTFKGVNGEFYQGEWQVDKMHGCGVYKFVGGAKFRGEWKYGKMDGYGVYENLENDNFVGKFEGQFLDGKMDGLGLYYWPQGDIFMGEYAQDKRHGSGVYTSVRGAIYKGEYRTGDRSGWGEFVTADGDVYEGQWRNNVRHGKGVVTLAAPDANLLAVAGDKGEEQKRWAEVWFQESPARPADQTGQVLDIDPTRTFTGYWQKGKVKSKRPYRYEDWTDIQTHSTLAADNSGLAVEETQKAVVLSRKSAEFAEEAAKRAIQKMQTEAEEREPYFVHLGDKPQPRTIEDRHMVRFGPELSRGTFLCMLGPIKAAELAANTAQVSWLAPVAAEGADADTAASVQGLLSPAIKQWMARARRQERKAPQWHVRRPVHQGTGPPPVAVRPPGGLLATLTARVSGERTAESSNEGMRERGIKAANELSNSALRSAMLAVRQEGAHVDKPAAGVENAGPGLAPRPPRYTQAQKGGNNHVPGRSPIAAMRHPAAPPRPPAGGGGGGGEDAGGNAAARPRPPPEGSPSTSARHSRMGHGAPKWAGGVAMPPSQEQMGRMAQRAR